MQSILEEFYYGNIQPNSKSYGQDSPFVEAASLASANLDKLMEKLDDSQKELFEKYSGAQEEIEHIIRYDTFAYALKFGILFMVEVFMGKGDILGEDC